VSGRGNVGKMSPETAPTPESRHINLPQEKLVETGSGDRHKNGKVPQPMFNRSGRIADHHELDWNRLLVIGSRSGTVRMAMDSVRVHH